MDNLISTLLIDTTSLPSKKIYNKIYPIISKRIHDRCATKCISSGNSDYVIRFHIDESLPNEAFRISDIKGAVGVEISGSDFLSLIYGAGRFLHKSRYTKESIIPYEWRGESAPQCEKRMIFFAQHFHNWYQSCSEEEIREHIEDLALRGINGVVTVFSCLNLKGWDDPETLKLAILFRKTLAAAREMNLKIGIEYSNIDFMIPNKSVAADNSLLLSKTGNLVCPSTEDGFNYYKKILSRILDYTDEFGGLDFITIWSYDEGGCSCDKCWPWGGKGFYNMAHRISKYLRSRYPKIEIFLATWHFGITELQNGEWELLYENLQKDAEKGDNWADYLLLETRDEHPSVFYPVEHGNPTEHTKLLTFPEISMCGITPWGGFGAICTPKLIAHQESPFTPHCNGGYIYTEGIFDDINKALILDLYWDRNTTVEETLSDYCGYEFKGIDASDLITLVTLIEKSHLCTNCNALKPCNLSDCDDAWKLAEKINKAASPETKDYWKWRIIYIRAYLDKVRYHRCAELGWPYKKSAAGWMLFWRKFLEHDETAQNMLSELIKLYKAKEIDDPQKYAYHWFVRPPRTKGADLEFERKMEENIL